MLLERKDNVNIDITYGDGSIKLSQPSFIDKLLQASEMQDANPRMSIPEMDFTVESAMTESEERYMKRIKYRHSKGDIRRFISPFAEAGVVSAVASYILRHSGVRIFFREKLTFNPH